MQAETLARYDKELQDLRIAYSKTGCLFSITLVLLGVGLDLGTYPQQADKFLVARVVVAVLTLLILWWIQSVNGRVWVRWLNLLWLALPQIMIGWMIAVTQGAESIYFVGLHLALYAVGIIVPLSYREGLAFGVFTCAVYTVACAVHADGLRPWNVFSTHLIFTAFSAIISVGCTYFNELGRLRVFELREQVNDRNSALQVTNTALAQVKGQLIQQEKMAALGTLSAGLLHEINNPVNYGMMALNMAMAHEATAQHADLKDSLADAREGMQRVQSIVGDLKTFAYQKPGDQVFRVFLFEKAVQSAMRLAGFELKGVEIHLDMPQDTHVLGDEPALIGVLINLLSNASAALRASGKVNLRIDVRAEHHDGKLRVHLRDNGTGIAPDHLPRVFEPFFTTRDVGAGLGLGLSVSYGIVQRHGGTLSVESELGHWTEFSFDLTTP